MNGVCVCVCVFNALNVYYSLNRHSYVRYWGINNFFSSRYASSSVMFSFSFFKKDPAFDCIYSSKGIKMGKDTFFF